MRLAILGATGLVGRKMLEVLEERKFPVDDLRLLASPRSAGSRLRFQGEEIEVQAVRPESFENVDISLFSAGGGTSRQWAPIAVERGSVVVDNSSAWRMDPTVPLVVPEVNAEAIAQHQGIIANPNCSTIQLVVALAPLQRRFGIDRVIVSTYQSISGAGQKAVEQLQRELRGDKVEEPAFSRAAAFNTLFHDFADDTDWTEEENKIMRETRKILSMPGLSIAATCVRIPTIGAHGESVFVELSEPADRTAVRSTLQEAPGVRITDDPRQDLYPTILDGEGEDDVQIGRLRNDESTPHGFHFWIVADNLRKGAATNAVQIAEIFHEGQIADG